MSPDERYRAALAAGALAPDPAQSALVAETERVYRALVGPAPGGGLGSTVRRFLGRAGSAPVTGIYAWGAVGRGKTHLVNVLHDCLPFPEKLRVHFHAFMRWVHDERRALGDRADPLVSIAQGLAADVRVLSLDEFHVADIADAMILGRLLAALFERGVTLIATSNTAPRDLYRDGLQRERFRPAIDLIEAHARVLHLDGAIDYRLRALARAAIYHSPLGARAEAGLAREFAALAPERAREGGDIVINGRAIPVRRLADGVAWFDFAALCEGPRAAADYLDIACRFHTVLVSGVPCLDDRDRDRTLRFVHLVDTLYDRCVNLLVSAAAAPAHLYAGERLAQPFARTRSRLEEMQSRDYLGRPHLP